MGIAGSMFGPQNNTGQPPQQTRNMEEILSALMQSAKEEGMQEAMQQTAGNAMNPLLNTAAADNTGVSQPSSPSYPSPTGLPAPDNNVVEGPSVFGQEVPNLIEVLHALLKSDYGQYGQSLLGEAVSGYQDIGRGIVSGAQSLTGASRTQPTNASKRQTAPATSRADIKGKPKYRPSDDED